MNPRLARWLVRLYPRDWRERYGAEFQALLETVSGGLGSAANIVWSALGEHVFPTSMAGLVMNPCPSSVAALAKKPSAFVPIAMSLGALAVVLANIAMSGLVHQADEGTAAHIWQLLMAGQIPILLFFALKWLPRVPRQSVGVFALQAVAALASIAPVFLFHL